MSETNRVDPRGLRFAAVLTSVVLVVALLTAPPWSVALLGLQAVVFGWGAFGGLKRAPYGLLFATAVRPRIGPPAQTEDDRPPRFAQLVGLVFVVVALLAFIVGATVAAQVAIAFALVAALLNATVGFCLGCETYLLARRMAPVRT